MRGFFCEAIVFVTANLVNVTLAYYNVAAAGDVRIFRGIACFQEQVFQGMPLPRRPLQGWPWQ
jgi:hypothetical protein